MALIAYACQLLQKIAACHILLFIQSLFFQKIVNFLLVICQMISKNLHFSRITSSKMTREILPVIFKIVSILDDQGLRWFKFISIQSFYKRNSIWTCKIYTTTTVHQQRVVQITFGDRETSNLTPSRYCFYLLLYKVFAAAKSVQMGSYRVSSILLHQTTICTESGYFLQSVMTVRSTCY